MSLLRLGKIRRDLESWVQDSIDEIARVINGRLSPSDNFLQYEESGTTPAVAGDEFTITHGLGKEVEFIYWLDGPGTLYESNYATWSDNAIKLKCTDAGRGYRIIVR